MHAVLHWVMKAIWLVGIIMLINTGLLPCGYDLFDLEFMQMLLVPFSYIAGIAGILGLMKFIRSIGSGSSWCGCEAGKGGCGCGHKMN